MKVFLTGATGFVGSHLARLLVREGVETHALVYAEHPQDMIDDIREDIRTIEGDFLEPQSWEKAVSGLRPDLCFHLAWNTTPGAYLHDRMNLDLVAASLRLAQILARSGCRRLVSVGTCFEYDVSTKILSESSPTRPRTLYAACKLSLLTALDAFCRESGMSFAWPRLFYLYGPGEHPRRLVPTLIQSFLEHRAADLTSGDKIRDYLHVEDVASALWAVARSDLGGPVNIGSGSALTIRDLAEEIASLVGVANLVRFNARPDDPADPRCVLADNRKLMDSGWKPTYNLKDGLRNTIRWWKGRPDHAQ